MVDHHAEFTREESSLIREARYHPRRRVLEIRLDPDGGEERVYFYEEVPEQYYIDLLSADSKGQYYTKRIKGEFDTFERNRE